jgi:hypothetical protein
VRQLQLVALSLFSTTGEINRANREKSDLIGWRQTLTTSPTNHIHSLLVGAKIRQVETLNKNIF